MCGAHSTRSGGLKLHWRNTVLMGKAFYQQGCIEADIEDFMGRVNKILRKRKL